MIPAPLLAIASSLLIFAAAPGHWSIPLLSWVSLIPLLYACNNSSIKQSAKFGFLCGFSYHLLLIYWIIIALERYGGLPLWVAIPALIGLAAYMALYTAAFGFIISWLPRKLLLITAPISWVALDYIRGHLFSGFPWQDLGYSQYKLPFLTQTADLTGHAGVTFHIIVINVILFQLLQRCRKKETKNNFINYPVPLIIGATLCMTAAFTYSAWRYLQLNKELPLLETVTIGLMQGNIDQNDKWHPAVQQKTVQNYIKLSQLAVNNNKVDMLIWPETALPFFPSDNTLFEKVSREVVSANRTSLLTGAPHYELGKIPGSSPQYFNSAFLLKNNNEALSTQRYDKQHLVPFGEYVPLQRFLPKAMPLVQTMGNFSPGTVDTPLVSGNIRAGTLICFESIFPDLARKRTDAGANILVNITNDAWYGRSSAPWQQVSMVVFRSIENRRSLARAANTGISCFIDPLGRIKSSSNIFEKLQLTDTIELNSNISYFNKIGFLFQPLCLLLLSLMLLCGMFCPKWGREQ